MLSCQSSCINKKESTHPLFGDVMKEWLEDHRHTIKKSTYSKYCFIIDKHIAPLMGEVLVSELSSEFINRCLSQKLMPADQNAENALSPSYIRTMAIVIKSALRFAFDREYCPPIDSKITIPKIPKKETLVLSHCEQEALESYILSNINTTGLGILLALYGGLRIGELCALSWEDIDFDNSLLHIRHTVVRVYDPNSPNRTSFILDLPKTASSVRSIPIASFLLPLLYEIKATSSGPFVLSDQNKFLNPRTFEYRYHSLLKQSKIRKVNFHLLRHTFATRCIESGVDVKSLSEMLGHSNTGITLNIYVHSSLEQKRRQLELMVTNTTLHNAPSIGRT